MNNYAIIENNKVINTVVSDAEFAEEQGWILLADGAGIGWGYENGQFIEPPGPTPEELKQANKVQAQQLLADTDWTATVDISNPEYSNPYLANQGAFLAYRSQIRAIAVNPPEMVDPWPIQPEPVWQSA